MFLYDKILEYPVNITKKDLKMAKIIASQYGGPQGELGAAIRYLNQRVTMPDEYGKSLLNDIGTEELAHIEMLQTMISQLMKGATIDEIKAAGLDAYYTEHGKDLFQKMHLGFLSQPPIFRQQVMSLLILLRIWQQNKRQEPFMKI